MPNLHIVCSKDNSWSTRFIDLLRIQLQDDQIARLTENVSESLNHYIESALKIYKHNVDDNIKLGKIIFFHWSNYIPETLFEHYDCITVHTSNLPMGRGGSPLQNQILDGVLQSKVNVLKTSKEFDTGDIYCSKIITMQGNIAEIWMTIAQAASDLITDVIKNNIEPVPQEIKFPAFKRRKDNNIHLENISSIMTVYDFIRMLDDGDECQYPNAYIEVGDFKLEFSRAQLYGDGILADVKITKQFKSDKHE